MSTGIIMGNAASINVIKATLTPAGVATITSAEQTFTVAGLRVDDHVTVNSPSLVAGVSLSNSRVSAADTLALTFTNPTAGTVTPVAGDYNICVVRAEGNGLPTGLAI